MKVWVTEFTDEKASAFRSEPQEMLWRGFVAALQERQPTANSKAGLPYLKLAKFSGEKSARNCLRYDRAVEVVSGVEIDYDAGELSIEEAALRLNKVGVEGVLQQSPSGTDTVHKWHGFFPLEEPLSSERHSTEWLKNRRRELSSALEQCLGVKLDGASHGLSHSFIFGNTGETRKTIATAGECVDAKFPSGHDRVPDSGLKRAGTSSDPAGIADLLPPVDPAEFAKALWSIPCAALSYDEWVKAGMACHHAERHCTAPMEGLDLWRSWSATDPERFKGGICEEKWPSFYGDGTTYKTVFWLASENRERALEDRAEHILLRDRVLGEKPRAETYLIEKVLCDQLSVFASYPGKGKTSAWVTIALAVCGATEVSGLEVIAPRHVVYASEHPEQVERILQGLRTLGRVDFDAVLERFHLVSGAKMTAEQLVLAAQPLLDSRTVEVTFNDITVPLPPYVVLDTASANLHIDDDNDNAAWSKVIAAIKQRFLGIPTTIIAHTGKEHKRGDPKTMTVRGASAIEGDVNQVLFLSDDDVTGERYIEIQAAKHRFDTDVNAIRLLSKSVVQLSVDRWGREVPESVLTVQLEALTNSRREEVKAEARQKAKDERMTVAVGEVLRWAKLNADSYPSKKSITEGLAGEVSRDDIRDAIALLLRQGRLVEEPFPQGVLMPGRTSFLAVSSEAV